MAGEVGGGGSNCINIKVCHKHATLCCAVPYNMRTSRACISLCLHTNHPASRTPCRLQGYRLVADEKAQDAWTFW